jgi:hypothetical protein
MNLPAVRWNRGKLNGSASVIKRLYTRSLKRCQHTEQHIAKQHTAKTNVWDGC